MHHFVPGFSVKNSPRPLYIRRVAIEDQLDLTAEQIVMESLHRQLRVLYFPLRHSGVLFDFLFKDLMVRYVVYDV